MPPTNKKYKLFAANDGEKAPCAFFASPNGCRMGDKCKFEHVLPGAQIKQAAPPLDTSSVISSESDESSIPSPLHIAASVAPAKTIPVVVAPVVKKVKVLAPLVQQPQPTTADTKKKKNKRKSDDASPADMFAKPKNSVVTTPHTPAVQPKQKKAKLTTPDLKVILNALPIAPPPPITPTPPAVVAAPVYPSFRNLDLPVASFSIPGFDNGVTPTSPPPILQVAPPPLPLPTHSQVGLKWQNAILETRKHPRYDGSYDSQKTKEADLATGRCGAKGWMKARKYGEWCAANPQAIAIDCEMCETKDPVTGAVDSKALCRISVINAEKPEEVLLDTLVKPAWPVSDYRSRINGIKKEHLENVQFTIEHAQAFMTALCSEETVIIGHAVHNDLFSLRMEHHCNVDSAFLFSIKDEPGATCSLRDLTMAIQQKAMPDTHDSVNDARMSLLNLIHYLEKDGKVDPITRHYEPRNRASKEKSSLAASQLFVHRIPKFCKAENLEALFLVHTLIQPKEVAEIEFSGESGKTLVTFPSPQHATLAFATLDGPEDKDPTGRSQKKVFLRDGGYVRVRTMAYPRDDTPKKTKTPATPTAGEANEKLS